MTDKKSDLSPALKDQITSYCDHCQECGTFEEMVTYHNTVISDIKDADKVDDSVKGKYIEELDQCFSKGCRTWIKKYRSKAMEYRDKALEAEEDCETREEINKNSDECWKNWMKAEMIKLRYILCNL